MPDGDLTYGGVDLRRTDRAVVLDLIEGFWEPATVRGIDIIIPGKTGRTLQNRKEDVRVLVLAGWVVGLGVSGTDRWQSFNSTLASLAGVFDATTPAVLKVSAPYWGVSSGALQLTARFKNLVTGEIGSIASVRINVELECIDSPPVWTVSP